MAEDSHTEVVSNPADISCFPVSPYCQGRNKTLYIIESITPSTPGKQMAQQDEDREQLLQEATALVERIEFTLLPDGKRIVVGFRQNGACSFFFDSEPVYQFNSKMQLRRAYVDGNLIGATGGTLSILKRLRQRGRVTIEQRLLETTDVEALVAQAQKHLAHLDQALRDGSFSSVAQVPSEIDVRGRVRTWLSNLPTPLQIADSPRVGDGIGNSTVPAKETPDNAVG